MNAYHQILFRMNGPAWYSEGMRFDYAHILLYNFAWYFFNPFSLIGGFIGLGLAIRLFRRLKNGKPLDISHMIPFGLVALYPFAWFLVAQNHSGIHAFFVCKTFIVPMMAVMLMLTDQELEGQISEVCAHIAERIARKTA